MSSDGKEATHVEALESPPPQQTFWQKQWALTKKYWWVHLISFLLGTLIVTLCLVYVGFPNIAQSDVDDSTLAIVAQIATDPKPDSLHLSVDSVIMSDSIYHPRLDPFNASLAVAPGGEISDYPFGYLEIPGVTAGDHVPVHSEQRLKIVNMTSFMEYTHAVMNNKTFMIGISGDIDLHEMVLPVTTVDYDKTVELKGLNGLDGFEIVDLKLNVLNGNSKGMVYIPNPSVLTIELGTVVLDLYTADKDGNEVKIGDSTLPNLTLRPGNNTVPMTGTTRINYVTSKVLVGRPNKYLNNLPITIKGRKVTNNDGQELPYYTSAVKSNVLKTTINLTKALTG